MLRNTGADRCSVILVQTDAFVILVHTDAPNTGAERCSEILVQTDSPKYW